LRAAALTLERSRRPWPAVRTGAAQVEVAVAQACLLADVHPLVDLERQRCRRAEDGDRVGDDLDLAGRQVGVDVVLPSGDEPYDLDAVLAAQVVGRAGEDMVAGDDLHDARRVPHVDEGHPAVIASPSHPAGEGDGLAGVGGTQPAGLVGAEHRGSFASVRERA
jgi:hypothetical protein